MSKWKEIGSVWEAITAWKHIDLIYKEYPNQFSLLRNHFENYILCEENRSRRRAGYCEPLHQRIRIHVGILKPGLEKIRDETFLHEVAHVIATVLFGSKGHDQPWKMVMHTLGLVPTRTHHVTDILEAALPNLKQVVYACGECGFLLTRSRRFPKRKRYLHKGCGGAFKLKKGTPECSSFTRVELDQTLPLTAVSSMP